MMGSGDTLTVIAATVIGGTSLFGGKGSIPGLLAGSVLLGLLTNGLLLAGFSVTQQIIVQGLVLLLALSVSSKSKADN
jgi:ribose transport system permease protein